MSACKPLTLAFHSVGPSVVAALSVPSIERHGSVRFACVSVAARRCYNFLRFDRAVPPSLLTVAVDVDLPVIVCDFNLRARSHGCRMCVCVRTICCWLLVRLSLDAMCACVWLWLSFVFVINYTHSSTLAVLASPSTNTCA